MARQFSVALRNARANAFESVIGTSPTLEFRTGAQPSDCAQADSGTLVASLALPSDWLSAASAGAVSMLGTWEDPAANAAGTIGHYRLKSSGGTVHEQGSVTLTGGGGDITLDAVAVLINQLIRITSWTSTEPNA